ncbi:hypothetical protein D3C87_278740 [compost metagenome]
MVENEHDYGDKTEGCQGTQSYQGYFFEGGSCPQPNIPKEEEEDCEQCKEGHEEPHGYADSV